MKSPFLMLMFLIFKTSFKLYTIKFKGSFERGNPLSKHYLFRI